MSHTPRALIRSVAAAALPSGAVPAPVLTGSPTLVGSWDFGDVTKLHLTSSVINSIDGSDGVGVTLTSVGSPTSVTDGTQLAAAFNGSSQYFQVTNDLGITASLGEATLVAIVNPASVAINQSFLQVGASSSNNLNQLAGISGSGFQMRKFDATTTSSANTSNAAYTTGRHLLVGRAPAGHTGAIMNLDGVGTGITGGATSGANPTMTTTIVGARFNGGHDFFVNGNILRCLVYNSSLSDANVEAIAVWAAANYGTPNNA